MSTSICERFAFREYCKCDVIKQSHVSNQTLHTKPASTPSNHSTPLVEGSTCEDAVSSYWCSLSASLDCGEDLIYVKSCLLSSINEVGEGMDCPTSLSFECAIRKRSRKFRLQAQSNRAKQHVGGQVTQHNVSAQPLGRSRRQSTQAQMLSKLKREHDKRGKKCK